MLLSAAISFHSLGCSSQKFSPKQNIIYEGVLNARRKVIDMLKPGAYYLACHKAAEGESSTSNTDLFTIAIYYST